MIYNNIFKNIKLHTDLYSEFTQTVVVQRVTKRYFGILHYVAKLVGSLRMDWICKADRIVTLDIGVACIYNGGLHGTLNNLSTSHPKEIYLQLK